MTQKTDDSLAFGMGILIGILGGIVAGILFSPKPGEEMRKDLKIKTDKLLEDVPSKAVYVKNSNIAAVEKLQYAIESRFNRVIEAVKAGRMAAAKRKEEQEASL